MSSRGGTATAMGSAGVGAGAAALATAATACCVGPAISPLVVGLLGAGGAAWAAGLKPYSPYLLAASGGLVAYSFWKLRPSAASCVAEDGTATRGHRSLGGRAARGVTWMAAAVWLAAVILNVAVS